MDTRTDTNEGDAFPFVSTVLETASRGSSSRGSCPDG